MHTGEDFFPYTSYFDIVCDILTTLLTEFYLFKDFLIDIYYYEFGIG